MKDKKHIRYNVSINSKLQPSSGQPSGIWTSEIAVGQIPDPWDKITSQMPGHVERFEFKCPAPGTRKKCVFADISFNLTAVIFSLIRQFLNVYLKNQNRAEY